MKIFNNDHSLGHFLAIPLGRALGFLLRMFILLVCFIPILSWVFLAHITMLSPRLCLLHSKCSSFLPPAWWHQPLSSSPIRHLPTSRHHRVYKGWWYRWFARGSWIRYHWAIQQYGFSSCTLLRFHFPMLLITGQTLFFLYEPLMSQWHHYDITYLWHHSYIIMTSYSTLLHYDVIIRTL